MVPRDDSTKSKGREGGRNLGGFSHLGEVWGRAGEAEGGRTRRREEANGELGVGRDGIGGGAPSYARTRSLAGTERMARRFHSRARERMRATMGTER